MPTFYDPVADAEEASQALRGLAHASRSFEHPEDAYGVIGDLLAGVRSLQQSIEQIAQRHRRHEGRAFDDAGDPAAGIRDAQLTADQLSSAATAVDAVEERLNAAMAAAGCIAWHPAPTNTNAAEAEAVQSDAAGAEAARESRWVNIVFLQGSEADTVLWLIDRDGPEVAIEHLAGWDFGDETIAAAMENGYVYDTVPTSALDKEVSNSDYALTYNHDLGHVSLYRQHPIPPEDHLDAPTPTPTPAPTAPTIQGAQGAGGAARAATAAGGAGAAAGRGAARSARAPGSTAARGRKETGKVSERGSAGSATDGSWFTHPGVAAVRRDRGLGL